MEQIDVADDDTTRGNAITAAPRSDQAVNASRQ